MQDAYKKSINEVFDELNTGVLGLNNSDIKKLQKTFGKNELIEKNKKTKVQIFLSQFKNIMIILLLIVGIISLVYAILNHESFLEPIVILGTSLLNCLMGYFQEAKAEDAIGKLKKYSESYVTVKRNGKYKKIEAKNLVVGDYIILESGNKIPADARIVKSYFGKTDESILTGESLNVSKTEEAFTEDKLLHERTNMVYSGTILVTGKIEAIVVAIGIDTEVGKIAAVMDTKEEPITPLQLKVQKISQLITFVACGLILFVAIYGLVNKLNFISIIMLCVSMIIASVPECLPVAITATLSIGVHQMAKKKSIVRNLSAIETLGAIDIICSDKTGTLTENKLKVEKVFTNSKYISLDEINNYQILTDIINCCNTALLDEHQRFTGDSVDVALQNYLQENKIKPNDYKKVIELPFDSDRKMMSVIYINNNKEILYCKGSFESLLKRCNSILIAGKVINLTKNIINDYLEKEEEMSNAGLKVLAYAYKTISKQIINENDYFAEENNLILVGLIGLKDPIRENVQEAIKSCRDASIRPIMLTGDNLLTSYTIAKEVSICNSEDDCINAKELDNLTLKELNNYVKKYSVFARVSPENKLQIIKTFQNQNKIVAMTGDGVNDAPAIKLANVGIGMGKMGTDVTKDVADIILLDDSFNTIVVAIQEGRRIYDNVITNILYNLSSNFTEILIILFGILTGNTIISALHILYIDLVADTIPSIMLSFEKASSDIMNRKPIGINKKIFTKYFTAFLITSVIVETIISLYVYYHFLPISNTHAQTLSLLSIIINEFVFAYNCRSLKDTIYKRGLFSNRELNIGITFLLLIQLVVFFTPIGKLFGLEIITISEFIFIIFINIVSFIIIELFKPVLVKKFADK